MSDVDHAEQIRQALDDHGVEVDDVELRGMKEPGPTRIIIDGYLILGNAKRENRYDLE